MAAYGLQTHIWSNNWKSVFLMAGFPVLLILLEYGLFLLYAGVAGYSAGDDPMAGSFVWAGKQLTQSWPFALIGAFVWFAIAYAFYQGMIDASTGAHKVERRDQPRLYNLLENLCISRGMKMPELRIMDTDAMNAFATGLHEGQYSITVTQGLLDTLDDDEVEAVLGHELTHIRNRDCRLLVIAVIFVGIFSFVAQIVFRGLYYGGGWRSSRSSSRDRSGAGAAIIVALVIIAIAYALAIVIRFSLSRRREYLADAGSVELTKNPDAMITALEKISGNADIKAPSEVREMFIENPRSDFAGLFDTHPPIQKRIDALVQFAGGHDPLGKDKAKLSPASPVPAPARPPGPWDQNPSPEAPSPPPSQNPRPKGPWG
jgi:heat shock protein HtpX